LTEATKILLGYGVVGAWAVAATLAAIYLFRENRVLLERLIVTGKTNTAVNQQTAEQVRGLVSAIVEQQKKRRGGRRPTGTVPMVPPDE
jgi:hypothetical protein